MQQDEQHPFSPAERPPDNEPDAAIANDEPEQVPLSDEDWTAPDSPIEPAIMVQDEVGGEPVSIAFTRDEVDGVIEDEDQDVESAPEDEAALDNDVAALAGLAAEPDHDLQAVSLVSETREDTPRAFEDYTLAEMVGQFWRAPLATTQAVAAVANAPRRTSIVVPPPVRRTVVKSTSARRPVFEAAATGGAARAYDPAVSARNSESLKLLFRLIAVIIAWYGGTLMLTGGTRSEADGLAVGIPFFIVALVVWSVSELIAVAVLPAGERWLLPMAERVYVVSSRFDWLELAQRIVLFLAAVALAAISVANNDNNRFTPGGILAWLASILVAVWAVAPVEWTPFSPLLTLVGRLRGWRPRLSWTSGALLVIILVGAFFRLRAIDAVPREMTDDHVEMLLDTNRLLNGASDVFFANNGGREAAQFYLFAAVAPLMGGVTFDNLKLLNAIEGILTLPILYWFGRVIIGKDEKQLGEIVGLCLAGLVAVSFWHEAISRLGERIVLMPIVTAILLICLTRALRYNRTWDWVYTGLALGFGLYTYQAFRLMPFVVLLTALVGLIACLRNRPLARSFFLHAAGAAFIAAVIFAPLFYYSTQYPNDYWRRTSGRLFGDALTQTTDENGNLVQRDATLSERINAFAANVPQLTLNIRNAALMYNWKGDVAWFNNYPNEPAFDVLTGALLVGGVAAWGGRMLRKRDAITWLMPVFALILMLPSAFSIAYPIENPSATRMSGTLPIVYLFAALAFAVVLRGLWRVIQGRAGQVVAVVVAVAVLGLSYTTNTYRYFTLYANSYVTNAIPYSDAGTVLRSFVQNYGGFGNAFVINFPYWWGHRALGIEAGALDWPNGIPNLRDVPTFLTNALNRTDRYVLDPARELLFIYAPGDVATQAWLASAFPNGAYTTMTTYQADDNYNLYRVPAIDRAALEAVLANPPPVGG